MIQNHDASKLSDDQLKIIMDLIKGISEDQFQKFRALKIEPSESLQKFFFFACKAKQFIWMTEALMFERKFDHEHKEVSSKITMLNETLTVIRNSTKLRKLIGLVLYIGNLANYEHGRQTQQSKTFPIAAVSLIKEMKTADESSTMLKYIVSKVRGSQCLNDILQISLDMPNLKTICNIDAEYVYGEINLLASQLRKFSNPGLTEGIEDFLRIQKPFLDMARDQVEKVVKLSTATQTQWKTVEEYLELDATSKPSDLLQILNLFIDDLNQEIIEQERASTASGTKSPMSPRTRTRPTK